ncbi:MAG: hypothetical protein ACKV2U_29715 [Bryobacteraceae bacterium]
MDLQNRRIARIDPLVAESRFPAGRPIVANPDAEHDFPTRIRGQAYNFLNVLNK